MRVLIVKTSSLGDVIHTLPALSDAVEAIPSIRFDWVVEQAFAEVPGWHSAVDRVIPVQIRQWRQHPLRAWRTGEWQAFKKSVRSVEYDVVIDAQGLLKSAWLTRYVKGRVCGLDKESAREPLAAMFYQDKIAVGKGQHAVERVRQLFASALDYHYNPALRGNYRLSFREPRTARIVLLHGTTWATKHWSEKAWAELAKLIRNEGFEVCLPWGNDEERNRASRIAEASGATLLERMTLTDIARLLAGSSGCVAVDTGLGHLAAAVETPVVGVFGPTNPVLTAFYGKCQTHITSTLPCAPCMQKTCTLEPGFQEKTGVAPCLGSITPEQVMAAILDQIQRREETR